MNNQEKLRKSLKYKLIRKLWIVSGDISRWFGKIIIKWSRNADMKDFIDLCGEKQMICSNCGGVVEWKGKLTELSHTECFQCGAKNCQVIDYDNPGEIDEDNYGDRL